MTTNAYIFAWDQTGIESIIPITQYESHEAMNTFRVLNDEKPVANPLNTIYKHLILRARLNSHRHYEIYAIDCDASLDLDFWKQQWQDNPQFTADLIRQRGVKLFSDRAIKPPIIT